MKLWWVFVVFGVIGGTCAQGDLIFSGTGRALSEDPRVTFPIRPYQLIGDSIFFDSFGNQTSIGLRFPILAAGAATGKTTSISFSANLRRSKADYDPMFGVLADGISRGIQFTDNAGGSSNDHNAVFMNDVIVSGSGSSLFQNAGFPAVGEDFTVSGVVTLSDTSSVLESTLGSSTGSIRGIHSTCLKR